MIISKKQGGVKSFNFHSTNWNKYLLFEISNQFEEKANLKKKYFKN